jgi:hypothetical protein
MALTKEDLRDIKVIMTDAVKDFPTRTEVRGIVGASEARMHARIDAAVEELPTQDYVRTVVDAAVEGLATKAHVREIVDASEVRMHVVVNEAVAELPTRAHVRTIVNEAVADQAGILSGVLTEIGNDFERVNQRIDKLGTKLDAHIEESRKDHNDIRFRVTELARKNEVADIRGRVERLEAKVFPAS